MKMCKERRPTIDVPRAPLLPVVLYLVFAVLALLIPELSYSDQDIILGRHVSKSFINTTSLVVLVWSLIAAWWVKSSFSLKLTSSLGLPREWLYYSCMGVLPVVVLAAWCKPFLSGDTSYYVSYGRQIVEYGLSPYKVNLYASASDPIISQVGQMWFANIAFYGPLALLLYSLPSVLLLEPTLLSLAVTLKFFWIPFYLLLGYVVFSLWRSQTDRFSRTLAVMANPLMIWFCLVDGHVDLLIACFLLATCLSLKEGRPVLSALALAAASSVKIVGIVCLPVCLLWWLRESKSSALRFSLSFLTVYGGAYWAVGGGEYLAVIEFTKEWDNVAAGSIIPKFFLLFGWSLSSVQTASNLVFFTLVGLLCLALVKGAFPRSPALPMACVMAALFLTRTYFQPWYTLWFWPLLWAASEDSRTYYLNLIIWTVTMTLAWSMGWSAKGWIIGSVTILTLALVFYSQRLTKVTESGSL